MSFVKKAIKKVIKTVKKIVKSDIFKWVVIAAAIFFTAGVAAGGFAAFSGVSTVGGFFTAVGQTIATGASAIAGALGFQGASTSLAGYGGAAAEAAGLTASSQILAPVAVNAVTVGTGAGQAASVAAAQAAAGQAAGSGFLASVKGVMGKKILGDVTIGQLAASGVTTAMTETLKAKANEADKKGPTYVAGGLSHGRDIGAPPAPHFGTGEPEQVAQGEPIQAEAAQDGAPAEEPSVAAQLAQGGEVEPTPASRIQALIQQRGPINQPGYGGSDPYAGQQGGLLPQDAGQAPAMALQGPQVAPPTGRTFIDEATQLQYAQRGLV